MISEPTAAFDFSRALVKLSETARSAKARSGGKAKKLKQEDQEQIVLALIDLLTHSTLPLAEIAQSVQGVPELLYPEAFGEGWRTFTSKRRQDVLQWIEGLPKKRAYDVRRLLIPIISEHDPKSARILLPGKPTDLESGEERERLARKWLGEDAGLLVNLLKGDIMEYELTRVLRVFLRLTNEPTVNSAVRSEVIRVSAQVLTEHKFAEAKTGFESILNLIGELIRTLPSTNAEAVHKFLGESTPRLALRLGLAIPEITSPVAGAKDLESAQTAGTESALLEIAERLEQPALLQAEVLASTEPEALEQEQPVSTGSLAEPAASADHVPMQDSNPTDIVFALAAKAKEYRDSALLLETAAALVNLVTEQERRLRKQTEMQAKQLCTLEGRIELLSANLESSQDQQKELTCRLREYDALIHNLTQSSAELSNRLAEANAASSRFQSLLDAESSKHMEQMDLLIKRMTGETDQRLEEFRNDVARRVSEVLRGTPRLDSVDTDIDGKAILFRVWEIIEILKRKSIPVRLG